MPNIELGFLESCEPWEVECRVFPSKVGGKPAWLSLNPLPNNEELKCRKCQQVMIFLCQIYAPYIHETSEIVENNFHRTIFLFVCRNEQCNQRNDSSNMVVFRNTLRRQNDFYPIEPPEIVPNVKFDISKHTNLCELCGIAAVKRCGKCKTVYYCCREHQVFHWNNGHSVKCAQKPRQKPSSGGHGTICFTEFEVVTETEELGKDIVDEKAELKEYEKLKADGKTGTLPDISELDLEYHATFEKDKAFLKFRKRIAKFPDQVIRYSRGGEPLYISQEAVPTNVPDCEVCGSARQFEFQVMPQMLSILNEIKLDWGVVLVYTCKNSCAGDSINTYKREVVFKQDVSLKEGL